MQQNSTTRQTQATKPIRRSRWGPPTNSTELTLPTAITAPMTAEQIEAYTMHFRIQEITHKLQTNTTLSSPAAQSNHPRSPSPAPEYDPSGRRTNTRPQRHRLRLERERHQLIQKAAQLIPHYQAPTGYHTANRGRAPFSFQLQEKVYIPTRDFPSTNFLGQLLGPRGRSLAELSARSGASIVIRGRGSVKEGRGRYYRGRDAQEPLHCLITASTRLEVVEAKRLVEEVIENAILAPEAENERKRGQLRELAVLNGTFRDDERAADKIHRGGRLGGIVCRVCGGGGHIARDYTVSFPPEATNQGAWWPRSTL
ncbi:hypothetical protein B0T16DRAFT_436094 [Cercophora newfieldiana]|uniref:Branchpoint-bridging protein n=1 Tax=Cercophora newfieldiana TaxID=92897 RepID=A0AA39YAE9_9PEZI|nr:hypothetical protein B0T16DRAFT_436094 [Cercophora newfieldiana]